jgi:hypothetical protein
MLYVAYDAAAGLIVYIALRAGAELLKESPTIAAAVVSGLIGPLLMRTKIPAPLGSRKSEGRQFVNAVAMLRRLQLSVSAVIDDRCAAGETAWILDVVLPSIKVLPLHTVEEWVIESITVKYRGLQGRASRARYIGEVRKAGKDPIGIEERKHLIIQILIDTCGRRQVIALVKRGGKLARADAGLTSGPTRRRSIKGFGRKAIMGEIDVPESNNAQLCVSDLEKKSSSNENPGEASVNDADLDRHDDWTR